MVSPLRPSIQSQSTAHRDEPLFLYSGSYGSVPIPVSAATQATLKLIEGNVDVFVKLDLPKYLTPARLRMAKFVGARLDEIVFVPNTSHGLNTILRNLVWNKEDIIVTGMRRPSHMRVYAFHILFGLQRRRPITPSNVLCDTSATSHLILPSPYLSSTFQRRAHLSCKLSERTSTH
jgi:hypothetical protein